MARWHNLCDNLKIHISECIVRFRALKDKHGIKAGPVRWPRGPAVRRSCATGSSHHFQLHTPRHALWPTILVRKLLGGGDFTPKRIRVPQDRAVHHLLRRDQCESPSAGTWLQAG
jgi:hypothetical protein